MKVILLLTLFAGAAVAGSNLLVDELGQCNPLLTKKECKQAKERWAIHRQNQITLERLEQSNREWQRGQVGRNLLSD